MLNKSKETREMVLETLVMTALLFFIMYMILSLSVKKRETRVFVNYDNRTQECEVIVK